MILIYRKKIKTKIEKINRFVVKSLFLVLLILVIYLSLLDIIISKTAQKKYAIKYIKKMFQNHLNNILNHIFILFTLSLFMD